MNPETMNKDPMQWTVMPQGRYRVCGQTIEQLPPGAYTCTTDPYGGHVFVRRDLQVDDLVDFPGSLPAQMLDEIERFWTIGDRFRKYGFLHRRGYLLYGKQGSGKSSLIHQVISRSVAQAHVAFFCEEPDTFVECVRQFRAVEPERPMLCIFEDIDAIVQNNGDSALLQWLDGNHQVDKAVNIATTNYPEELDRRIVSRPRRFDRILRIDSPDPRLRDAYLARKVPDLSAQQRKQWVEQTQDLSFAALAELIISVCCLGHDLNETVTLLKELDAREPSSREYQRQSSGRKPSRRRRGNGQEIPF